MIRPVVAETQMTHSHHELAMVLPYIAGPSEEVGLLCRGRSLMCDVLQRKALNHRNHCGK